MKITRIQAEAGVWKPKVDGQVVPDYLKALCTYDLALAFRCPFYNDNGAEVEFLIEGI